MWFVYSDMSDVDTIGAQVSHDSQLHERFEDYEEEMGFESRSEAVRSLLRTGLDAYQEEQEQHREEARTSTATEEWCRDRFQTWFSGMLLSGSVTLALWLSYGAVVWYPAVNAAESLPTQLIALLIFVGVVVFLAFGSGALVTGLLLRTGYAARIDLWQNDSSEQESAA